MLNDLKIFAQASAMARHAAERHRVIAENVANADTPNYRARDLRPFDVQFAELAAQDASVMRRMTRAHEIEGVDAAPNGNTVSLEDQMARSVDAQVQHDSALQIYRKAMDLLRISFSNRR